MDGTSKKDPNAAKTRCFLTRKTASKQLKAQATLITSISAMELDTDPGNHGVYVDWVALGQPGKRA